MAKPKKNNASTLKAEAKQDVSPGWQGRFEDTRGSFNWEVWAVFITLLLIGTIAYLLKRKPTSNGDFFKRLFFRKYNSGGYVLILNREGQEQLEHRVIAEEVLGRPLMKGEVVHHINGKRDDNRPKNLCVMESYEHDAYHRWFDWIVATYGVYPKRETSMRKLRNDFGGTPLEDILSGRRKSG